MKCLDNYFFYMNDGHQCFKFSFRAPENLRCSHRMQSSRYCICFIACLRKKFSKFVLLILPIFYEKIPKISKKILRFSTFFKSEKLLLLNPNQSKITMSNKIWPNVPLKLQKDLLFLKNSIFSKFSIPPKPDFLQLRPPP